MSSTRLDEVIRTVFTTDEDVDFEEGYCIDWAVGLTRFLRKYHRMSCRPLVVYDQHGLLHCAVWVDELREAFDWKGAGVRRRWFGEWKMLRNFHGLVPGGRLFDLVLLPHHDVLGRLKETVVRGRGTRVGPVTVQ